MCYEQGVGDLCVESRLCWWDWIKGGNGRVWGICVLRTSWVRAIE